MPVTSRRLADDDTVELFGFDDDQTMEATDIVQITAFSAVADDSAVELRFGRLAGRGA